MKRLLLLGLILLLVGCGSDEESTSNEPTQISQSEENQQEETTDDNLSQAEWMEQNHPEEMENVPKVTDNTMEFADKTNDINNYTDGLYTYEIVERYSNEETDEKGMNKVAFGDYLYRFSVVAVVDDENEEYILFVGETENNTEETLQFNSDIEIVTSNQEQTTNTTAVGSTKPDVIESAFVLIPIERGIPESFSGELLSPWIEYNDYEQGDKVGEPIELEFTAE